MQYLFTRNGQDEVVEPEKWQWEAYYHDGTVLRQFENHENGQENGRFHQFHEIDQSRLAVFKMISYPEGNKLPIFPVFVLPFDGNSMKLIHYYLHTGLSVGTPQFTKLKWYVFGYQSNGVKHLTVITHSGEVITCEDTSILKFE